MEREQEWAITAKAARIGWELAQGRKFTALEISRRFGMSRVGAYLLLCRISDSVPVYVENGEWREAHKQG